MTEHAVVIAGAGPTGMMLAAELTLAGVDVAVVERRPTPTFIGSRAGGLHARTIEVFDQRGIAERFISEGQVAQVAGFAMIPLDISDFPTRHPYGLALWQRHSERILAHWVDELGVRIYRGREVTGVAADVNGVTVDTSDGTLRAEYLVGCDGGRSLARKAAGIEFAGWDATTSAIIGEVRLAETPEWGFQRTEAGQYALMLLEDGETVSVLITETDPGPSGDVSLAELSKAMTGFWGTDYGVHSPDWISRFTDAARQATTYRNGRILVAGDAAHIHWPAGGQGLNIGVQDAVNLGWKLAQVVKGMSPEALLDTYQAERYPVAARVLQNSLAQVGLQRTGVRVEALRDTLTEILAMDEPRKTLAGMMSGLDIHYDFGDGHPLLGRRIPDLDVVTGDGPLRVYTLLHSARPALINLGQPGTIHTGTWSDRVAAVDATYSGEWELPVLGKVQAPHAVLVRPDGYVAWVGSGTAAGLKAALTTWFGAA